MIGSDLLVTGSPSVQAAAVIGVVLVEAVLLYAGYGVLEDAIGPTVFRRLKQH